MALSYITRILKPGFLILDPTAAATASQCQHLDLYLYLLDVGGGLQAVVGWVHHGHVRAAVHVQHLLHAVDAAALAAGAEGGAGHRVVAAQAVHLAAGRLAILHHHKHNSHSDMSSTCSPHLFPMS